MSAYGDMTGKQALKEGAFSALSERKNAGVGMTK